MIDALSIDRFHNLVASYGADPDRWPAEQRGGAIRCLVDSEVARAAWRDAAELDVDLDGVPGLDASPALVDRVLAIGDTPDKQNTAMVAGALRHALPYAAAAAIALVVGLAVPSPLRDATGVSPQDEAAVGEPAIAADSDGRLNTLALVDARTFADDEADTDEALSDDGELGELPLL